MTPSVDSHCEQERADEEQAMVSGEAEWDRPGRSANIGNSHTSVMTPWDVEIARLRADLAAATARAERAERSRDKLRWLARGLWGMLRCRYSVTAIASDSRRWLLKRRQASQHEGAR